MPGPGRENKKDSASEKRAGACEHSSDTETGPAPVIERGESAPRTEQAESTSQVNTGRKLAADKGLAAFPSSLSDRPISLTNGRLSTCLLDAQVPLISSSEAVRAAANENDSSQQKDEADSGAVTLEQCSDLSQSPDESDRIAKRRKGVAGGVAVQEAETTSMASNERKSENEVSFFTSDNSEEEDKENREGQRQLNFPCSNKGTARSGDERQEKQDELPFDDRTPEVSGTQLFKSITDSHGQEAVNSGAEREESSFGGRGSAPTAVNQQEAASALPRFARLEQLLVDGSTSVTTLSSALASLDRLSVVRIISRPVFASLCATAVLVQLLRRCGLRFEVRFGISASCTSSGALLEFSGSASPDFLRLLQSAGDSGGAACCKKNNGSAPESATNAAVQNKEGLCGMAEQAQEDGSVADEVPVRNTFFDAERKNDFSESLGGGPGNTATFRVLSQTRGSRCVCASLGGLFLLAEAAVAADAADLAVLWPCAVALEYAAEIAATELVAPQTACERSTGTPPAAPGEARGCRRCSEVLPNWLRRQIALCEPETGLSAEQRTGLLFARNAPIAISIASSLRTLFGEKLFSEKNYGRLNEVLALAGISIGSGHQTYIRLSKEAKKRIDGRFGLVERFVLRLGHDVEICGSEHAILIIRQLAAGKTAEAFFLLSQFEQRSVLDMEAGHRFLVDLVAVFRKLISRAASVSGKNMVVFRAQLSKIEPAYDVLGMLWRLCAAYAAKFAGDRSGAQRVLLVLETDSRSESVFFSMNMDVEKLLRGRSGVRCLGRGLAVAEQEMRAQVLRWVLGVERRAAKC